MRISVLTTRSAVLVGVLATTILFAQELPEGEGKELVTKACTVCHGLGNVINNRFTTEEWRNVALDMDAPLSDAEIEKVAEYLGKYFGPDSPPTSQPVPGE